MSLRIERAQEKKRGGREEKRREEKRRKKNEKFELFQEACLNVFEAA